jgi:hypothetical protein
MFLSNMLKMHHKCLKLGTNVLKNNRDFEQDKQVFVAKNNIISSFDSSFDEIKN